MEAITGFYNLLRFPRVCPALGPSCSIHRKET